LAGPRGGALRSASGRGVLSFAPTPPHGPHVSAGREAGTSGRVGGCVDRSIFVCHGPSCASFGTDEVQLEIHEEGQWRRLVLDGDNAVGTVQIELLYRERR
jgi:hypothetical protein